MNCGARSAWAPSLHNAAISLRRMRRTQIFPRRAVTRHAGSAVLAYDAQIAAAGNHHRFNFFRVGIDEFDVGAQLGDEAALLAEAIRRAAAAASRERESQFARPRRVQCML